jgi:hypothetical protein
MADASKRAAAKHKQPLRRRGTQKLLPADALRRLRLDLGDATGIEPVVVYAADLRTMIELFQRPRRSAYQRRWLRRPHQ